MRDMVASSSTHLSFADWQTNVHPQAHDIAYTPYRIIDPAWQTNPSALSFLYFAMRRLLTAWAWVPHSYCKLAVAEEPVDDGTHLRLTVIRLDNVTEKPTESLDYYRKVNDLFWRRNAGWPNDLLLELPKYDVRVNVPAQAEHEVAMIVVENTMKLSPVRAERPTEIPRHIFMYWSGVDSANIPPLISKAIAVTKHINPGWSVDIYGPKRAREMIERLESPQVLDAYDTLVPQAFKTDLWRLVVLYHRGGIYMDAKVVTLMPLDCLLPERGAMLVRDMEKGYLNSFMAHPARDPFLREAIEAIVRNVTKRSYPINPLSITGPYLLEEVFNKMPSSSKDNYDRSLRLCSEGMVIYRSDGIAALAHHNGEYRRILSRGTYAEDFHNRQVYGEKTPNPKSDHHFWMPGTIIVGSAIVLLIGSAVLYRYIKRRIKIKGDSPTIDP